MGDVPVLSWNVFHGRDHPPEPALYTCRSRLLRTTERGTAYVQVNRSLFDEFASLVAGAEWSICFLQELPPTWAPALARRSNAEGHLVLTSRNQLAWLRRRLAHWNPDLLGSWEGGSNLVLARPPWQIVERRAALLNPLPRRGLRERRRMALAVLAAQGVELCVANLHASAGNRVQAEEDVRWGAQLAIALAGGRPLVFGGDLNLRPRTSSIFAELERRLDLAAPTAPDSIDHILVRGLRVLELAHPWPAERRDLPFSDRGGKLRLRLSDHAPVEAVFSIGQ
jgi:endonuclease/exonuclease/phosphatase family metal-dependent hydrolase